MFIAIYLIWNSSWHSVSALQILFIGKERESARGKEKKRNRERERKRRRKDSGRENGAGARAGIREGEKERLSQDLFTPHSQLPMLHTG